MGSARTHAKKRQRKRKILRERGLTPQRIEKIVGSQRRRQADARRASTKRLREADVRERAIARSQAERRDEKRRAAELQAAAEAATYERLTPDDRRHRPATGDSLTQGRARATGMTARAVKRTKAMTKWEYDELEAKGA